MNDSEYNIKENSKAILVSIVCSSFENHHSMQDTQVSLDEMCELLKTLNIERGPQIVQKKIKVDPASIVGLGKLEEIALLASEQKCDLLVFDFELSASQIRNIKEITNIDVVDRVHIILEIFARHARTKEAKIQIEISRLEYILPRLSGFWSHLGRQRSAKGSIGGEGEQQIELDRRIIRHKISFYKKELVQIEKSRKEQRKKRHKQAITAALVGYTNAGKSSILNRLCNEQILEKDQLFATLDSTYRLLTPNTKPPMILIDTVGFISNLPNTLIKGFKTTLDSAKEADLLVIVCDISNPHYKEQLKVTNEVLAELKLDSKNKIIVFNKADKLDAGSFDIEIAKRITKDSFVVSSFNPEDMENLKNFIINYFLDKQACYDLFVPFERGDVHSIIHAKTNVLINENFDKGIYYKVRSPDFLLEQNYLLKNFLLSPDKKKEIFS